ncbi:hypothetical protein B808_857 [Fructilactobacillus florum 8D]|uniref:Uncharacterized protein n=1 Tax=Fructilactobacillus florum 8D TaxID=1221538 RepID=W9EDN6_9LACO|nr:hypothetical protein [Fructilactobacillus florum]EKK20632.1 hypothetical protein B807_602 [Fructilactobacillus florum 2F]ETO40238.1 hypothetical protein B808_857 [Fructilactobacillus florum 8D]
MKLIKKLHNLIKHNYENGKYINKKYTYNNTKINVSDYKLGQNKALSDFDHGKFFKIYPQTIIEILNSLFKGKFDEILNFIKGYNETKSNIKNNS